MIQHHLMNKFNTYWFDLSWYVFEFYQRPCASSTEFSQVSKRVVILFSSLVLCVSRLWACPGTCHHPTADRCTGFIVFHQFFATPWCLPRMIWDSYRKRSVHSSTLRLIGSPVAQDRFEKRTKGTSDKPKMDNSKPEKFKRNSISFSPLLGFAPWDDTWLDR